MQLSRETSTRVLVIEDNPVDVHLMRLAFENEIEWRTVMTVAEDGEKAIDLLAEALAAHAAPDFVVLDLNLPKRDGTEVLQWMRSTDGLEDLPVAIVSSSPMEFIRNKVSGASVEANCYFVKPMDVDDFLGLAKKLHFCYRKSRSMAVSG